MKLLWISLASKSEKIRTVYCFDENDEELKSCLMKNTLHKIYVNNQNLVPVKDDHNTAHKTVQ